MKNIVKIALICVVVIASLLVPNVSNAMSSHGYSVNLIYNSIVAGTATEAEAQLISHNSDENYDHVRVNFDVQGPATPEIIAYEDNGTPINVLDYGYWGPAEGFPIYMGEYVNKTRIVATFPVPGTYTVKMDLVDMDDSQAVIASETYKINVGVRVTVVTGDNQGTYVTDGIGSFDSLAIPEPEKDGYIFAGWYTDANFTTALDTTKDLTENTTVYAKFEAANNTQTGEDESNTTGENTVVEENKGEKDETPKTGVANYAGIAVLVIAISAATLFVIRKNRI